jgi:GNAT superfamily N-acetyltransferase
MPKLRSAYEQIRLHGWEGASRLLRDNLFATARCLRLKRELPRAGEPQNSNAQPPNELQITAGTIATLEKLRATEVPGGWPEDFHCDRTYGLRHFYLGFWNGTLAHIVWFAAPGEATTVSNWQPAITELEMRNAYTQKAFRGRGIFQQVARVALRELQTQGFTTVYAHVDAGNVASLRGLRQLGFVTVEEVLIRRILGVDSIQTRAFTTHSASHES